MTFLARDGGPGRGQRRVRGGDEHAPALADRAGRDVAAVIALLVDSAAVTATVVPCDGGLCL